MDIYNLIEKHQWSKDKPSLHAKISTVDLFKLALELREIKEIAERLDVSTVTVARWFRSYEELPKGRMWPVNRICGYFEHKSCSLCKEILPFECFYPSKNHSFKRDAKCKTCNSKVKSDWVKENPEKVKAHAREWRQAHPDKVRAKRAKERAAKLQRTPTWANQEKIQEIYSNCPEGYHVDHIVPLQGELVSGLHVENNLQYLPASENSSKGNKFQVA